MDSIWDIRKKNGDNDFGLWKVRMQEILTHLKCVMKDEASMHAYLTQAKKTMMVDKARSAITLCLKNKVLREVTRKKIASSI